jgi:adenylate cyclase
MTRLPLFSRPVFRGIGLGLLCALIAWLLSQVSVFRGMEDWMLDGCFSFRGTRHTHAHVVIIGLDDPSLDKLGKPLAYTSPELAEVVKYVHQQGAAAIGLDMFIPQSMSTMPGIEGSGGAGDAHTMGQAILEVGNVVLPEWHVEGQWQKPLLEWQFKSFSHPEPTDFGFVNFTEDGDQFIRRQQMVIRAGNEMVPQLSLAVLARAWGVAIRWNDAGGYFELGGQRVPLDAEQKMRIDYVGPPGTFPEVPFSDVLADARKQLDMPELKGAIVLVGLTARSQHDYHVTPYANSYSRFLSMPSEGLMSGTEVQANILATIIDRAYIFTPARWARLLFLLASGAGLGWCFARLNLEWGLLLAVIHHVAWRGVALTAFTVAGWRLEMVPMLLLGTLTYAGTFAVRWRLLRRMLGVVKSEAIALALEADPRQLDRRGEERQITVLFADIRSFTTFSESHTPHQVVALLNAYYTAIVPIIDAEGGTINQYMGDGIMVLFGAPASNPDHARQAVRAGVAMVKRVHELHDQWVQLGYPEMRIGVGIHTGKAVIGCVGSPERLDYTAIGDTVNAAARIESENKKFGTEVLISARTREALSPEEWTRIGGASTAVEARVKGKAEALRLYPVEVASGQGVAARYPNTADRTITRKP